MIKTCRITDLLPKKEHQRAIALVEASLQLDARLISTAVRNFMYCGLSLCYLAIGKLGKAAEWLDRSLSLAEQDRNYSFLAGFRKYFQVLFLLPSIAAKHERAIRDLDPVALVEPHLRRRQFREQAARAAPRMLPHRNDDPVAALLGKVACEVTVAAHLAVPLEYRPVRHLAALPQEPHLRRRELSVVRNQAAATSRGVLYGAARGAVEPRNA